MVELSCYNCGRVWNYTGNMSDYATCPDCDTSVKIDGGATPVEQRLGDLEERVEENHRLLVSIRDRLASRGMLKGSDGGGDEDDEDGLDSI